MTKKIALLVFFYFFHAQAAVLDAVYLHGVVTTGYQNVKYVSVRDSFDQEYVLPKSLIEAKTGRKIANTKGRDFRGSIYFFEVSNKEYATMQEACIKDEKLKSKAAKICPPLL